MHKTGISALTILFVAIGWAGSAKADPPAEVRVSVQQVYCAAESAWCNPFGSDEAAQPAEREALASTERSRVLSELSFEPPVVPGLVEVQLPVDQLYCQAEQQWCFVSPEAGQTVY